MILYISLFGIFLSFLLIYNNAKQYPASIYLGAYFFLVSLYGLNQYLIMSSDSIFWIAIIATNFTSLYYLLGPISYLYIRSVQTNNYGLKKIDFLHLLPALIYLVASLPHIFSSYAYKVHVAEQIIADRTFLETYHFTILTDWITSAGVYISRPALVFMYMMVSVVQTFRFFSQENALQYSYNKGVLKKWLFTFLSFQLVLILSHLFFLTNSFALFGQFSSSYSNVLYQLSLLALIGFILSPLLFPQILYGLSNMPHTINENSVGDINDASKNSHSLKSKNFDDEYMLIIQEKIETAMTGNKLFLLKEFNLPQLSVYIQVPNHHLIYFFSNFKKQSFNDYRNEFRIRFAKALILQDQSGSVTLEAIGLHSGFSNRNTFSKAFKEIEGVTPSVFVAQNK